MNLYHETRPGLRPEPLAAIPLAVGLALTFGPSPRPASVPTGCSPPWATEIAGVLMVFSYLVAPAIIALGSSDRWGPRIVIAWAVGFLASAAGLIASYQADFPSGPAIVCSLGLFLLLFAAWRMVRRRVTRSALAPRA